MDRLNETIKHWNSIYDILLQCNKIIKLNYYYWFNWYLIIEFLL